MESEADTVYGEFMEKVKRTIYLDNISPQVNESVIKTAFEQYGNVINVHFIPNYTDTSYNNRCALVEVESVKQAETVIETLSTYPFMMSGMPRPVRARAARPEMFDERPTKPGKGIEFYWLDPRHPDFEVAQKMKKLVEKHSLERSFLLKKQEEEEERLSRQQAEALKGHYQKFESLESAQNDVKHLGKSYGINFADDHGY